ncbi:hypothetical protein ACFL0W_06495 [Nanoarchaeota archaeon]
MVEPDNESRRTERKAADFDTFVDVVLAGFREGLLRYVPYGDPGELNNVLTEARKQDLVEGDRLRLTSQAQADLYSIASLYVLDDISKELPDLNFTGHEILDLNMTVETVFRHADNSEKLGEFIKDISDMMVCSDAGNMKLDDQFRIGAPYHLAALYLYQRELSQFYEQ